MPSPSRAKKRFGQNFLVNEQAARRIVEKVAERAGEIVLEIGPGRGALTARLLDSISTVAAVEIDRDLAKDLEVRFPSHRFRLIRSDFLRLPLKDLLDDLGMPRHGRLFLAGNLPYNISKRIARKMVQERRNILGAVFMFQKEVAERLTASPGTRAYGPLAIYTGSAFRVVRWFDLAPGSFRPRPSVLSTVTLWEPDPAGFLDDAADRRLRRCLAVCFRGRRQTVRNNLRRGLSGGAEAAGRLLSTAGIDGELRAEALSPSQFLRMAEIWPEPVLPEG